VYELRQQAIPVRATLQTGALASIAVGFAFELC